MLNSGSLADWAAVGIAAIALFSSYLNWRGAREYARNKQLDAVEGRLSLVEAELKDLPSKTEMVEMHGEMKVLAARLEAVSETIRRIEHPLRVFVDAAIHDAANRRNP